MTSGHGQEKIHKHKKESLLEGSLFYESLSSIKSVVAPTGFEPVF